jgi:uncharacterized protein YdiU (UPF0061 family)
LLNQLEAEKVDFSLCFRRLAELSNEAACINTSIREIFEFSEQFTPWLQQWRQRLADDPQSPSQRQTQMFTANPVFIPRNHLVQEAISAAETSGDFSAFNQLVEVLEKPAQFDPSKLRYAMPPKSDQRVLRTFCGT